MSALGLALDSEHLTAELLAAGHHVDPQDPRRHAAGRDPDPIGACRFLNDVTVDELVRHADAAQEDLCLGLRPRR